MIPGRTVLARDVKPGDRVRHHYPARGRQPAGCLEGTVVAVRVLGAGPDLLIETKSWSTSRHPRQGIEVLL